MLIRSNDLFSRKSLRPEARYFLSRSNNLMSPLIHLEWRKQMWYIALTLRALRSFVHSPFAKLLPNFSSLPTTITLSFASYISFFHFLSFHNINRSCYWTNSQAPPIHVLHQGCNKNFHSLFFFSHATEIFIKVFSLFLS